MVFKKNNKNKTLKKSSKKGGSVSKGAKLELDIPDWVTQHITLKEGASSRDRAFGGGAKRFKRTRKNKKGGASRKNKKGASPSWKPQSYTGGASRKNKKGSIAPWKPMTVFNNK